MPGGYVDVTTRCNLSCTHCCRDFGAGKRGQHMTRDVWVDAIRFISETCAYITLGGGEFFLHPAWKDILEFVIQCKYDSKELEGILIVTNGTMPKRVWQALEIIDNSGLSHPEFMLELSDDQWHIEGGARLDGNLLDYFKRHKAVRTVSSLIPAGRAVKLQEDAAHPDFQEDTVCPCDALHVRVDGSVHFCACPDSHRLGHVSHRDSWSDIATPWVSIQSGLQGDSCWNSKEVQGLWKRLPEGQPA